MSEKPSKYKYGYKLTAPSTFEGAIARRPLIDRIFEETLASVVLLQAPAGHGKTTLLQQVQVLGRERGWRCAWFTADVSDNDLRRFSMHLDAMLGPLESEAEIQTSGDTDLQSGPERFLARLSALNGPVALFFDDVQFLRSKAVLAFLKELIAQISEPLRIFLASRSVPDIGLARLVVNQQALVLRADDLCFSAEEVTQFFGAATELAMRRDEIDRIYAQTEGWPAALQLFRLSLASPQVRAGLQVDAVQRPRALADYLADNVIALQPAQTQAFLRRTAFLTRLSGPLCDHILECSGSQATLQRLERSGLFIRSLDTEPGWFRYHALFASLLQEQLGEQDPAAAVEVHRKAARWFGEQSLFEDAIFHAVEADEYGLAAEILDAWSSRLIPAAQLMTVERWYEMLPLGEVQSRPDLLVKVAWALSFLRRHQKLKPIRAALDRLTQAEPQMQTNAAIVQGMLAVVNDDIHRCVRLSRSIQLHGKSPQGFEAFELGAAANLSGYLDIAAGDFEAAREHLVLARAYGEVGSSSFSLGYSISMNAMNLIVQGQLDEALARFRQGHANHRLNQDDSLATASLAACHLQALYESNDLAAAEKLFNRARAVIEECALLDYVAVAFVTIARIYDDTDRSTLATEALDDAENLAYANLWPRLVRILAWERVRRCLVQGRVERARVIASRINVEEDALPAGWLTFAEDAEGDVIGGLRLAIHSGEAKSALPDLGREIAAAEQQGRVRRQMRLLLLEAVAQHALGADKAALQSLNKALHLGADGGYVRAFLDEGPKLLGLMQAAYQALTAESPLQAHLDKLLDAAGIDRQARAAASRFQVLEPLTEREKTILIMLAQGVSNEELARQVFVSKNTIKFHLKNIYSKLAVRSRLQAINAARQMGLVP
ncbi:MAG: LuxR C-terminal-related transcriptional regulator [Panacagrimonas sp.]